MTTKRRLPRFRTGETDLDQGFDAWREAIEQSINVSAPAPLDVRVGPSGIQLSLARRSRIVAKLTSAGTGGKYAWTQQYRKSDHTWANLPGGLSGTTTTNPAMEKNANTSVVVPLVVDLELDPDTGDYTFQAGNC